jgi:hypothetical protein
MILRGKGGEKMIESILEEATSLFNNPFVINVVKVMFLFAAIVLFFIVTGGTLNFFRIWKRSVSKKDLEKMRTVCKKQK